MKKFFILVFLLVMFRLPASTIIVNSVYDPDRDPTASEAAGYIEDGLMDVLFDHGVILFSTFNAGSFRVEGAKDARYMISIEPRTMDESVSWSFQATVNGMIVDSGTVNFTEIEGTSGLDSRKLYYLIGEKVAQRICLLL